MVHVHSFLEKRSKNVLTQYVYVKKQSKVHENFEQCKNRVKCDIEAPLIYSNCLHVISVRKFDNWSSGNLLIDEFFQKCSDQYLIFNTLNGFHILKEANCAVFPQNGFKESIFDTDKRYYSRLDPCLVGLKKNLKNMKHLDCFLSTKEEIQNQYVYFCLNGITEDPSTLEYILAKLKSLCDSCLHKVSFLTGPVEIYK
ncbi:hypothetical protein C2G38_2167586 [Gigaspora rosea]|uniref:Uncharacterized protein n=1 Tax=Gigaspora rosea TaxID=44941 RepID=A0A397W0H6_9GLOM|nr:hypothetical protein C2G38_2167586 [Gigaspora rosea]